MSETETNEPEIPDYKFECIKCGWHGRYSLKASPKRCASCQRPACYLRADITPVPPPPDDPAVSEIAITRQARESSAAAQTPAHYQSITGITPWDFCAGIQTSGNPFADHLRCSAIEYAFRIKEDPAGDLIKAANCLLRAAAALDLAKADTIPAPESRGTPGG